MRRIFLSALAVFTKATLAFPGTGNAEDAAFYYKRGNDRFNLKEYDEAIADFDEAIRLNPNDSAAAYYDRGLVWVVAHKNFHKAISDFDQAIRLKYPYPDGCYCARALCWDGLGEHDKAIADVDHVIRGNPKDALARYDRGIIRFDKREYDKAIADFDKAIELCPTDPLAYNHIAWIQATCSDAKCRDGKRAIVAAEKACELTGSKDWNILETLAAAYAESGDFEKALDAQTKALAMIEKDKSVKAKEIADARSRFVLYIQSKPFHEEPKKK